MHACTILQINPTRRTILLSIFISLLYMFRATMCPSSGEITVSMRQWYLSLYTGRFWSAGWNFIPTSRPEATHTEWQIPLSHRYSNFSWWWAHGCPKHVEKWNKYTKKNFALSWIFLQDCTRMHDQKNLKFGLQFIRTRKPPTINSILPTISQKSWLKSWHYLSFGTYRVQILLSRRFFFFFSQSDLPLFRS